MSHIFISYVREDQVLVDKLVSDLKAKGALIWLDPESIKPGELWQEALKEAIQARELFHRLLFAKFGTEDENRYE